MIKVTILLLGLLNIVSCDISEDTLRAAIPGAFSSEFSELVQPSKGHATNCDPSESSFYMGWYPNPIVKGETVTVEGNYTFPEEFHAGVVEVHIKAGFIPVKKIFKLSCSMISDKPCVQGYTAVGIRTLTVPEDLPLPPGMKIKVQARLINSMNEHEIGCAEAELEIQDMIHDPMDDVY